jgi:hypothetical protein
MSTSRIKNLIEYIVSLLPYVGNWRKVFLKHSIPGDYGSPIPDLDYVKKNEEKIFKLSNPVFEIDLNDNAQLALLDQLKTYVDRYPYGKDIQGSYLYTEQNNIYYKYHDAIVLFTILLYKKPKKIIEIGSGYSSALMMDVNSHFFMNSIELKFIEPFPENRLNLLIGQKRENLILKKKVQDVDLSVFKELEFGDILFVDSSHVSKIGSDLNYILFEILPNLNSGVIIHFHDIYFPFEYPQSVIYQGYAWNEIYLLRAFLMYNNSFDVIFMNSYLGYKYKDVYTSIFKMPYLPEKGGALWIQKK